MQSLAELVATGRYLKRIERQLQQAVERDPLDFDAEYRARLENRGMVRELLVGLMDRYRLEALVYPFTSRPAAPVGTDEPGRDDNPISAITGLPAIVVPAGVNGQGLPIALEFLGRPFSEPELIHLAHAYEQASQGRIAPTTTPHLPGEVFSY